MRSEVFNSHKGKGVHPQRTICEVHREIYDLCIVNLQDRPALLEQIVPRLEEVFLMGVKLAKKLVEHKLALPDWEKQNMTEAAKLRLERMRLEKILETGSRLQSAGSQADA